MRVSYYAICLATDSSFFAFSRSNLETWLFKLSILALCSRSMASTACSVLAPLRPSCRVFSALAFCASSV